MLPRMVLQLTLEKSYQEYIQDLKNSQFSGEIRIDYGSRLAVATDNSVYQVIPHAVLFPKTAQDVVTLLTLASGIEYQTLTFSPRGGGTGTNGQSLSSGIIIDCSKYMTKILEINSEENWIRVQPGVILDQLNDFLKIHQRCFAPQISPSNRATLGGMVNTDACGNGSKVLGRTSDYVLDLTCVRADGQIFQTSRLSENDSTYSHINTLLKKHAAEITQTFTHQPRDLNGYNLLKANQDKLNLNYLLCGSEGTLAVITEIKLKIQPIPVYKKLILVKYTDFNAALRAQYLQEIKPLVIEAIDEILVDIVRKDNLYLQLKDILDTEKNAGAISLVEFVSDNQQKIEESIEKLSLMLNKDQNCLGFYIAKNPLEIKLLWDLRKKSVGLISKRKQGTRRPIPFIEDTAVPPEKLAGYIADFKKLLNEYGLIYGMYGHVDAGCVHVRPALDLKLSEDEKIFKALSDKVSELVKKYNGVMWGEHGQGYRSQYTEHFFGKDLYHVIRQIKTLFDPHNKLNPGKIAVPLSVDSHIVGLTDSLRAHQDKKIFSEWQISYENALSCNGNGACFNYSTQEAMCPSYKVTKDRIHSPKGRASLIREWLKQLSFTDWTKQSKKKNKIFGLMRIKNIFSRKDFSHEVYQAMNGCLSCKSCAGQCPLNVDIPDVKSRFLYAYHTRYFRPLRDYVIAMTEKMGCWQIKFPYFFRILLQLKLTKLFFNKLIKLQDLPLPSIINVEQELKKRNAPLWKGVMEKNSIILLQDIFTTTYEPEIVLKTYDFLIQLGYVVYVLPLFENGKPLHVKGFIQAFAKRVEKNNKKLQAYQVADIPMIGIEPSITLTYRDEYQKVPGITSSIKVQLLQEWLIQSLKNRECGFQKNDKKRYFLLSHCTEKSLYPASEKQWQEIFTAFGLTLTPIAVGCCGMAGSYGHEVEHQEESKALFAMDWKNVLRNNQTSECEILVTGYSCRCQAKRFGEVILRHPIEVLYKILSR